MNKQGLSSFPTGEFTLSNDQHTSWISVQYLCTFFLEVSLRLSILAGGQHSVPSVG